MTDNTRTAQSQGVQRGSLGSNHAAGTAMCGTSIFGVVPMLVEQCQAPTMYIVYVSRIGGPLSIHQCHNTYRWEWAGLHWEEAGSGRGHY